MVLAPVGLVGAGRWGDNLIRNFFQLGALKSICDHNEAALTRLTAKYPKLVITSDFDQLLADPEITSIVISTPALSHQELARKALLAGKHVYVEKPLARTIEGAQELIDLADSRGLVLMVGHLLVYHPAVNALKHLIKAGDLGEIRFINSDRRNFVQNRSDTSVVWDLAPHDISMICYLLEAESAELIHAVGVSTMKDGVIDVAHIDLAVGSKAIHAHVHNSWIDPQKQNLLTVNGSKKTAVLNDTRLEGKLQLYSITATGEMFIEQPFFSSEEPLRLECEHFLACVASGDRPKSDGLAGYQVVRVLELVDEQIAKES